MMMATPASTISRAATRSQQRKPLAALLLGFSLPRRPYQDMTKISTVTTSISAMNKAAIVAS
jgi:hypothetical protein